ncbi:MAG: VOC family protein [Planctomycetaceae bacterium]
MSHSETKVECTIPVLPVKDLARSIEFYTGTFGFTLDWGGEDGSSICSVSRDACHIMLSQGLTTGSSLQWVWIGLADETLFEQ